jgi:replicative DNA helicase
MDPFLNKIPPHNDEAEQSVLGAMILENSVIPTVMGIVSAGDFYRDGHNKIFTAIFSLFSKNVPADLVTLSNELRGGGKLESIGGMAYIASLVDNIPSAANVEFYAKIVQEAALKRALITTTAEIFNDVFSSQESAQNILDASQSKMFKICTTRTTGKDFTDSRVLLQETFKVIEERYHTKGALCGLPSGYVDLDNLTAGFQKADLIIMAGRPSMGKTALALNIMENVSMKGVPCAYFSLEMQRTALSIRMLSSRSKLTHAAGDLTQSPFYINDIFDVTPMDIRSKARRLKAEKGLELLIVDYLQLMMPTKKEANQERELATITRELKGVAKDLDIPVIALSQLNRDLEKRPDKRPCMADLRGSGAIEQDADLILFIYRDEVYDRRDENPNKGIAEVIIGKQRNGAIGSVKLAFRADCTRFNNMAKYDYE